MSLLSYGRAALAALVIVLVTVPAAAQTPAVIDPRVVEFDPSPDHSAVGSDSQPVVTRYSLELYLVGGTTPVQVANLAKPAPQTDGKIRVDFTSLLSPWPASGTTYEARVAVIGPSGTARSDQSNTFAFSSPCSSSISPTSLSLAGAASTGSVAVTAVATCPWSATSNATWITITAGAAGTGNGTVSYSVTANNTTSTRTGTMTIAGQTFTLTQAAGCTFSISPSASSVASAATTGTVSVSAGAGCTWTASSSASWITITSGASGAGPGSVGYSVSANTGTAQRTGTLTIAGRTFTVTQDALSCSYSLSPVNATLGASASSSTVAVSAASGCAWTATTQTSWITVTSGASGNGNGQVGYSVAANPSTTGRSGSITIGGQTFAVTQAGQTCTYAIAPVSASVPADATTSTVSVDTLAGCNWTATSSASWISVTSGASGSGDGTVGFSVAANTALASRSGALTIGGQTFTVTQGGVVCDSRLSPTSASAGASGSQSTVAVTMPAPCAWTASSPVSWITITSGASGQGDGTVGYTIAANTSTSSRSANLTIAGRTFAVAQAGVTCAFTVSPLTASATAAAGTGTIGVTSTNGCAWTASSAVSWITITSGTPGSGPGTVGYSFAANPTTQSRAGVVTVAGQPVTITQAAGCGYAISPASASLTASSGTGSISVSAGSTCAWSAQSPASWITFTTATSGTGTGSVGYQVAANGDSSSRSATITVAGQPFVVTQAGAACDAVLTPTSQNIVAAGGNGSVDITVPGGCAWSAVPSVSWLTVLTGASGAGSGTITYRADANPGGQPRTGTIAVGGRLLTVTQAGASCAATVSSTAESFEAAGGSRAVSVTIASGCVWTALSNSPWITITSGGGSNTTGNAAVAFQVSANTSTTPRTGSLTVAGRTVAVDQAGTCDITIAPTSVSTASDAGSGSVAVSTGATCSWTASSSASWLTITGGASGTGNGSVLYAMTANTGTTPRTATMTIGGRVFSVTQAAPVCSASVSPTSVSLPSAATSNRTIAVTNGAGCPWTASSSASWLTIVSGATGSGSGTVSYSVTANTTTSARSATLTVAGQSVVVTQGSFVCTVTLSPTSVTLNAAATNASFSVASGPGCPWSATSSVPWITVTSGSGEGDGTVQYSVASNPNAFGRNGIITVGSRWISVSQTGNTCNSTLSSTGVSVGSSASTVPVGVSATADCPWTATSTLSWISIVDGANGSGPGTATLAIEEHTGTSPRSGAVTIAGRTFTVIQSGGCTFSVSPTAVSVGAGASFANVWVTTGASCTWSLQSSVPWVTFSTTSGTGNAMITVSVAANLTASQRTTSVTIAGTPVQVTQAGSACNYAVTPLNISVNNATTRSIEISAPAGCAWTAVSSVPWITFPNGASGTGSGTVVASFAPMTVDFSRSGFITIAGWRISVTQRGGMPPSAPGGARIVRQSGN